MRGLALTNFVATFIVGDETELILTPFACDNPSASTFVIPKCFYTRLGTAVSGERKMFSSSEIVVFVRFI